MKVILNLSMLGDKPTGLGVYSLNCAEIANRFKVSVIGRAPANVEVDAVIQSPESIGIGGGKLAAIKRQLWMRKLTFDREALVYSPTHHGLPGQENQIITIHDMICLRFPMQHLPQYIFFRYLMPRLLKKCRAVFTVSETSRRDILRVYRFPPEKVYVVPNAVDVSRFVPGRVDTQSPYLLMVGARYSHKNVDEVLQMAALWKDKYRLVVTSCSGKYRQALEKIIGQLGISDRVEFRNYVSDAQLLQLYQGCKALVYPSKWEGFGIPPLEALACSRPVIASDIEIHREVLGDAALFVKLNDESSWREVFSAIEDESTLNKTVSNGKKRLAHYTQKNSLKALEASLLAVEKGLERT
ncbi:glycosyltransferase family 4 protein [Zhongshania aliphaticivorans]|uniref:glycosyltransferase family 4 protein n=1 Tax=Zhongshania aliphaticivorans TaxID=1470434 RepID=UPI0012E4A757|nr:glycosyltransferase family 1 protein [Zhongshania aliphaticivorans]CAA0118120.1 Alpha-maltose-1-phosphate synthase [Zhongshania aliphaticivorans]